MTDHDQRRRGCETAELPWQVVSEVCPYRAEMWNFCGALH